jgi:hypothetical protein
MGLVARQVEYLSINSINSMLRIYHHHYYSCASITQGAVALAVPGRPGAQGFNDLEENM